MSPIDYWIIIFYFLGMLALGVILSRSIKNSSDMFAAGKKSPWWLSGISGYMSFFSAATFVVWGGIAFKSGLVAVSISMSVGVSAFLVGWLFAKKWRKIGVTTAAEYIQMRFGDSALQFYTWYSIFYRIIAVAVSLYSIAVLFAALVPLEAGNILRNPETGNISVIYSTLIIGAVVIFYTVAGGLWAVMLSDVLQFIVLSVTVIFVVPLGIIQIGGIGEFINQAPGDFFTPVTNEFTWLFLTGWIAVHTFKLGGEWVFIQRFLSVPTPRDARKGAFLFGALYLVTPIIWMLPPMMYRVIEPGANPEQAYILACQAVLPVGMVGLMISAMFSATASMVDSEINVFAGVLTRDIYRPLFKPRASENHLTLVGRIMTGILGVILVSISLSVPYLGGAEEIVLSFTNLLTVPIVLPTLWGLFSGKIDQKSVWVSAIAGLMVGAALKITSIAGAGTEIGIFVNNNMRVLEVGIGLVVPISVLLVMQQIGGKISEGFNRVQQKIGDEKEITEIAQPSTLPAKFVSYSLLILGTVMIVISIQANKDALVIFVFALALYLVAGLIFLGAWKVKRDLEKGKEGIESVE